MAIDLAIRKARATDAETVRAVRDAAILSACARHYPEPLLQQWTDGELDATFIEDVAARFYVACIDSTIVATGCIDLGTGKIDAIFVLPEHMRSGIGRSLLAFLEQLAKEAGLTRLTLDATLNAAPFYRACGYVGETVAAYRSPRGISLACVPMTKDITSSKTGVMHG